LGFGCKLKLIQIRVYKTALRLGEVDMTGGDDEEVLMQVVSDNEDPELAQANVHLAAMKGGRAPTDAVVEMAI
jgi:hypothetical protein